MKTVNVLREEAGFTGTYFKAENPSNKAIIVLLGDKAHMVKCAAKWLRQLGCNVLGMYPLVKEGSYKKCVNYEIEYFERAVKWLRNNGNTKIGIVGGSTWAMMSLAIASIVQDFSLVLAFTPADFVMQGFYQGKKDGMGEWPAKGQSSLAYKGKPLPYQPFYLDERGYWECYSGATKRNKEPNCLEIFRHSEKAVAIPEEAFIKVENIKGHIVLIGAEDDSLWDTVKYCERMKKRLEAHDFKYPITTCIYPYGTHFLYPESMMKIMVPVLGDLISRLFVSGRKHPKECKEARIDVEKKVRKIVVDW